MDWAGLVLVQGVALTVLSALCMFVDLQEARNLSEFGEAHRYLSCVATPAVVWELTSTRCVLVLCESPTV